MPLASTSRRKLSKLGEQRFAVGEPIERDAVEDHVGFARAFRFEGAASRSKETWLARACPAHLAHLRRKPDERRNEFVDRTLKFRNDRAQRGPAARRLLANGAARQTLKRIVVVQSTDYRTDDRELVHLRGEERQVFANLDSRNFRGDGLELAANFRRRIHLQIEHVLMRRAARQENHDDSFVRASRAAQRFSLQQLRKSESAQTERANPQKVAPRYAITKARRAISVDRQHGVLVNVSVRCLF